jgi:hypothetical protein
MTSRLSDQSPTVSATIQSSLSCIPIRQRLHNLFREVNQGINIEAKVTNINEGQEKRCLFEIGNKNNF